MLGLHAETSKQNKKQKIWNPISYFLYDVSEESISTDVFISLSDLRV